MLFGVYVGVILGWFLISYVEVGNGEETEWLQEGKVEMVSEIFLPLIPGRSQREGDR